MGLRNFFLVIILLFLNITTVLAESASLSFSIDIPAFFEITSITSPILNANITDKTGNLNSPLYSKFRVVSNILEEKKIYLRAQTATEGGVEEAMFDYGGRVYVAFSNIVNKPSINSLNNCKDGAGSNKSPGVVAYPISSIIGVKNKYLRGQGKYEFYIKNGVTDITVNVGANVLKNSFGENDPKGFYQATLLLTEADI